MAAPDVERAEEGEALVLPVVIGVGLGDETGHVPVVRREVRLQLAQQRNPADYAHPPKLPRRRALPPRPEQVAELLNAAAATDEELAVFLWLAVTSGARRGELVALRWTGVALDRGLLRLESSYVVRDGQRRLKGTKTGAVTLKGNRATVVVIEPRRGPHYAPLEKTSKGWRVLEYNARFGDPEAEVTLPRLEGDFARLMVALGEGKLAEYVAANPLRFSGRAFVDVVLCAENYPGTPKTGMRIDGLDRLPEGVFAFHGATRRDGTGNLVASGGRVIHMVASGENVAQARDRAYAGAEHRTMCGFPGPGAEQVKPRASYRPIEETG